MTSDKVRVSIIIPCFNQALVTAECLASISVALPSAFAVEVLVVDNASSDKLYAAVRRAHGIKTRPSTL